MTNTLTKDEFLYTMNAGMEDVTGNARPVLDIWPYVEELVNEKIVIPYVLEEYLVEKVFRDKSESYDHVLLPTADANTFIILVIDIRLKSLIGHYKMDLNKEYGL